MVNLVMLTCESDMCKSVDDGGKRDLLVILGILGIFWEQNNFGYERAAGCVMIYKSLGNCIYGVIVYTG